MNIEDIRASITELSGSGKKVMPNARKHGIYCSFTLPGLEDMLAVRDTKQRFADSEIPIDLDGVSVIDVGSNVGAIALEFARRGAMVVGVEYRDDRVALCNVMARHWKLDAEFYQADFNAGTSGDQSPWLHGKYQIVWCASVDEYINDLEAFYSMLHALCSGTLYLESNLQGAGLSDSQNMVGILERAGFIDVEYLGNGHSGGISRKRKLYRAKVAT